MKGKHLPGVILREQGDRMIWSEWDCFAEPVLSTMRFFAALRMTGDEGFRMT